MKAMTGYTVAALCVATFFGIAFAACDSADSPKSQAGAQEAEAQAETVSSEPVAHYDEGRLALAVSIDEARKIVAETARKLISDVEEVTFEEPTLEMVNGRPYLMMRGERPDGNCALAYTRLMSEEVLHSENRPPMSELIAPETQSVALFGPPVGGSCTGDPCNGCELVVTTDGERCYCRGIGDDEDPEGFCNHSTGG